MKTAIFVISCNEFALYCEALLIRSVQSISFNVTINLKCSDVQFSVMQFSVIHVFLFLLQFLDMHLLISCCEDVFCHYYGKSIFD